MLRKLVEARSKLNALLQIHVLHMKIRAMRMKTVVPLQVRGECGAELLRRCHQTWLKRKRSVADAFDLCFDVTELTNEGGSQRSG